MSLTATEIVWLMEKAKELGISTIKVEGMEAQLTPIVPVIPPMSDIKDEDLVMPASPFDDLTDEEILYYATPYYDELQAKKEAMKQQKKEDEELRGN